ncbi:MAG: lamin tail domain-containing protein, partial [Verrucomicrobiales bacterium]
DSQRLRTDGTRAWRAFGDPRTTAAFQGDGSFAWRVEFTYDGASEAVVSSSDFGTAKIDWGVIDATGTFGIEVRDTSSSNPGVFSTAVVPVVGQKYLLAGRLDFGGDRLLMWINPEPDSETVPTLSVAFDGDDWSSGLMLMSSSDGTGVIWDDLEIGEEFGDLNLPVISPPFDLPDLTVSEFMASNTLTATAPDGGSPDWIEILNATSTAVDLEGWYLSDDPEYLTKWSFPSHSLAQDGRLLVWASGDDRVLDATDLHTNFKLDADGDYLALVKPDGVTVVQEFSWGGSEAVIRQYADVSYGTLGGEQVEGYFAIPTPGAANVKSPYVAFSGTVLISEMVAAASGVAPSVGITDTTLPDAPNFSDWIELHNPGATPIDLSGCRLSDDPQRRARWRFPPTTVIPAGGYLVVLADGADAIGDYAHTNFGLAGAGGYLGLYDPNGVLLDEFSPGYPQQVPGFSYAREGYLDTPTPGAENGGEALSGIVAAPTFSIPPGFHDDPLTTLVSSVMPGATVHTEIGSALPDQSSPTTASFTSSAGEVLLIRARAYAPGMVPSAVVSASYLMNASQAERSMPAMHFIGDDYTTFWDPAGGGDGLGIIDHYEMRGRPWERPINLELHFPDGRPSEALGAGLRYAGHGDRPEFFREANLWDYPYARPQFNLFFRGEYGSPSWEHDLFSGLTEVVRHDSLRVRLDRGLVDEFIRRLWVDMGNHGSVGTLANLYINGVLRTVVNPVQRIREPLLQEWYDTRDGFDVLSVFDFPSGDESEYSALEDFFEDPGNDFTQLGKYLEGGERLDYTNFVDYMLLLSYMATTDWPGNNKHAARQRVAGSKFKFYVWDAQQSMADGGAPPATEATIDRLLTADDTTIKILSAVMGSEEFRLLWADRVQKHFLDGGALSAARMNARWFQLSDAMDPIFNQIWGESIDDSLFTDWRDNRLPHALGNYASHGLWFDDLLAPRFSQHGGPLDGASAVTIANPTIDPQFSSMNVYYTMDGTDPREPGGAVNQGGVSATASSLEF